VPHSFVSTPDRLGFSVMLQYPWPRIGMVAFVTPIEIATAPKTYRPVRQCIYCKRRATKLSLEHIVPFGLAANSLRLPAASCTRCQEKTKQFETVCLRHMWWPFRTKIGAPSRHKETPETFLLRRMTVTSINVDGSIGYVPGTETAVPPDQFPLVYMAFKLPPPAILAGRDPEAQVDYEIWAVHNPEEFHAVTGGKDKEGFRIGQGTPVEFTRLLAKIAHSYAAAELGLDAFEPILTHYIRNRPMRALEWIGGDMTIPPPRPILHDIRWRIQRMHTKQFVVVGELRRPLNQFAYLEQPLYTIDVKPPLPRCELIPLGNSARRAWP
jgi:hypothetical protein